MSATVSEVTAAALAQATPLPADALPPSVQKLLGAPGPMKLMAAKGAAPLRPADLVVAIYQLSFDADAAVKAAAEAAPGVLPDRIVGPALAERLPAPVLHFFAGRLPPTRSEALEKVLYNAATADETFVLMAGRLAERELEIIFENEARLLRCPAILAALFGNREARMSSLNRAIELCARNGVRVEGIPAFDEVAKSISETPPAEAAAADATFAGVLAASEAEAAIEPAAAAEEPRKKSLVIDFTRLKLHE